MTTFLYLLTSATTWSPGGWAGFFTLNIPIPFDLAVKSRLYSATSPETNNGGNELRPYKWRWKEKWIVEQGRDRVNEEVLLLLFYEWRAYRDENMKITVKASNFEPHGNFGPILARSVASLGDLCTKNEQNRVYIKFIDNFHFLHFFFWERFDDSKPFWERKFKVYMRSKVRGFDGRHAYIHNEMICTNQICDVDETYLPRCQLNPGAIHSAVKNTIDDGSRASVDSPHHPQSNDIRSGRLLHNNLQGRQIQQ